MPQTDFTASPFGAIIATAILEDYRFNRARPASLFMPPAFIGHNRTVLPRGPFDLPVKRDGDADAVIYRVA